jgi:hypothetical protein
VTWAFWAHDTHSIKGIEAHKSFNPFFIPPLTDHPPISHTMNELDTLVESARQSFAQALTPADLENAKALYLGKAGRITELMKGMAALSVEEKKTRQASDRGGVERPPPGPGRRRVASPAQG